MSPLDFLRAVWPEHGKYCVAVPVSTKGMKHVVFDTIEDAASYCEKVKNRIDVYFAIHVLKEEYTVNDTGKRVVRVQKNMRAARTFFFDIDVDAESATKYHSQLEAITALKEFVRVTGLPKPMVVSSGGGVHVYWSTDTELESNTAWATQAARLKQLANHHHLKVDPARTTDTSSILRVAGTINHKRGEKRPVTVLMPAEPLTDGKWQAALKSALENVNIAPAAPRLPADLVSNLTPEFSGAPPSFKSLVTACAQMRRLAILKGNYSEPQWYFGAVGVTKFTENGDFNVHKMSSGYPGYNHDETQAKLEQWTRPPTSCAKLREVSGPENDHLCAACRHVVAGPIMAARNIETAEPPKVEIVADETVLTINIPNPPPPYKRARSGGVEMLMEDKEGKQFTIPIYPYDLYPIDRRSNDLHETEQQAWRVHLPHGAIKDFTIEASTFVDDKALRIRLANNGIYARKFEQLRDYMSAYIQGLVHSTPASPQHNHLGWTEDRNAFILADKVILADGTSQPAKLSSHAADAYDFMQKRGTLDAQVKLLDFFDRPEYVPNQFCILAGLGSTLFFATGHAGAIINVTGEPGASKSTALFTAAGFWGNPNRYVLNGNKEGATSHSRNNRIAVLSSLPFCLDEITRIAADMAKDFAMNISQFSGRTRLNSDGTPKKSYVNDKSNIVLTSANVSMHSLLSLNNNAGTAAAVRVFEVTFRRLGIHKPYEADAYLRNLRENFGHIGEKFITFVVKNREAIVRRVVAVNDELARVGRMRPDERFWFSEAAAVLVAAEIAYGLKLSPFLPEPIRQWLLIEQLPALRRIVGEESLDTSPIVILTDYLEHINGNMVKLRKPTPKNPWPDIRQEPRGELLAHYDLDLNLVYVLKENFRRFCERRGQYSQAVLSQLAAENVVIQQNVKRTLGSGTDYAKGRSMCFVVNMSHPEIADTASLKIVHPPTPSKLAQSVLKAQSAPQVGELNDD